MNYIQEIFYTTIPFWNMKLLVRKFSGALLEVSIYTKKVETEKQVSQTFSLLEFMISV